jgi:Bax protein
LRTQRAQLRAQNKPVTGYQLAEGLVDYSELREAYVNEIQAVIRINKLAKYDQSSP